MNLRQDPLGVPLREIADLFDEDPFRSSLSGSQLTVTRGERVTQILVVRPEEAGDADHPVQAVVRVITDLSPEIGSIVMDRKDLVATFNRFAALGALFLDQGKLLVGSRLTIYRGDGAWDSLHMPLLVTATIHSADAIVSGIHQLFTQASRPQGRSSWTGRDFKQVLETMSRLCACSDGPDSFTAEIPLEPGQLSAALGSSRTALLQLRADQPHPAFGPGLLSLLEMPDRLATEAKVLSVCEHLNRLEMDARDLPPHFGAWCPSQQGNRLCYISFLPNLLHGVSGIALNSAIWALNRAEWASEQLKRLQR